MSVGAKRYFVDNINHRALVVSGKALGRVRRERRRRLGRIMVERLTRRSILAGLAANAALSAAPAQAGGGRANPDALFDDAFLFAFPIYEFARTAHAQAAATAARPQHRFNEFTHRSTLADHTSRVITTPNNDTIYSSARLDLTRGPAAVEIPDIRDRYFSVAFMNAFTDNFAYVGTRATKGAGGKFLIAGPQWRGDVPAGMRLIQSASNDVWALARLAVANEEDFQYAIALQRKIRVIDAAEPEPLAIVPASPEDPLNFVGVVNAMLGRISARRLDRLDAERFAPTGLARGSGQAALLAEPWRSAIERGLFRLRSGFTAGGTTVNGWRYADPAIGGEKASPGVRASVALSGLAALTQEESLYAKAHVDAQGDALDGKRAYRLSLTAAPPCDAFWSISLYEPDADGRLFFVENPLRRYSIGDRTAGIHREAGGGVEILLSHEPPSDESRRANWLPTPGGPFHLVFRAYLPHKELQKGKWRLPAIEPIA